MRTLDGRGFAGKVDILTGGFPCQPHSVAGKREGARDERNLWPETARLIGEVGPRYVLLENVPGILANGYGGTVVGELSELGYDCRWGVVSAADVGANHLRKRWWVLAYTKGCEDRGLFQRGVQPHFGTNGDEVPHALGNGRRPQRWTTEQERQHDHVGRGEQLGADGEAGEVADADKQGQGERCTLEGRWPQLVKQSGWWLTEPDVGRVADGVANRMDRPQ